MNLPQRIGPTAMVESKDIGAEIELVLQNSLYPGASLPSIRMVKAYCRAAQLDPMQKPVHIVPMWDQKASQMRDVIMPGINLYRIQAARSGAFAGVSEPTFGPMVDQVIGGVKVSFPEWASVTVRRIMGNNHIAEFTAREYWIENYAEKGGKEKSVAPNKMWMKRTRGQIAKCAEAQALRKAFPEVGSAPTAEEMEGRTIADFGDVIEDATPTPRGPQRKSEQRPQADQPADHQPADEQGPSDDQPANTESSGQPASGDAAPLINAGQVKYLQAKIKAAGVDESSILARFEIGALAELDTVQFDLLKSELLGMS